ncbi:quinolinate synthase NadA [Candidatus Uhrbacteria bacterium]|nr:quinolinate synthase NadA [Candidatus Uhrbacteria bacterium]
MQITTRATEWHHDFQRYAADLYPGRYTMDFCHELAALAEEIRALAAERQSTIAAHYYTYPEVQAVADVIGDSLKLSRAIHAAQAPRVDFASVFFMGETAKITTGDTTRVFVQDTPETLGCSLVFGTDLTWIRRWRAKHPDGIIITYVNSSAYTKSLSDYISTSRNTDLVIATAARAHPGCPILVLPDKYLGHVMRQRAAMRYGVDPDQVEVYQERLGVWNAACYVHEEIGPHATEAALEEDPAAELLIHPECGCASSCLRKVQQGIIPQERAYFCSTEQMIERARSSPARRFIVATEKGMVYRLRKAVPEKEFVPVSAAAECRYMKANNLEKLLRSLREDRMEIVSCDDCCDPEHPFRDERTIHLPRSTAAGAKVAIDRMLAIPETLQ